MVKVVMIVALVMVMMVVMMVMVHVAVAVGCCGRDCDRGRSLLEASCCPAHLIIDHVQALSRRTAPDCAAPRKTEQVKLMLCKKKSTI